MLRHDHLIPEASRLDPAHPRYDEIMRRHAAAVEVGHPTYRDPTSGLSVFTAAFLADRNSCCGTGCRHCPYLPAPASEPTLSSHVPHAATCDDSAGTFTP